jgi:hypothetical protein
MLNVESHHDLKNVINVFAYTYENNHHVVSVAELEGRAYESLENIQQNYTYLD